MKRLFALCFFLLASSFAQAQAVDKLNRYLDGARTLRADFTQTVTPKNGKRPQQSSGLMLISRPGKFRWQIDKPYAQLLVGDGEKVWMYDPDLRQATVRKVDAAIGSTPAALLVGGEPLEKRFTLREAGAAEGLEWVEATPRSTDSGFEKLRVGFSGEEMKAMELFDNFGQTTLLRFSRIERNPSLAAAQFSFTPPAGVDVIGE